MEGINWTVVLSAASLELVLITSAIGVVWKLSRSEMSIRTDADLKIAAIHKEHTERNTALSEKIYQVEIWARDEFVRKGSFELVIGRMEKSIEKIGDKIDTKFDELTKRIDATKS